MPLCQVRGGEFRKLVFHGHSNPKPAQNEGHKTICKKSRPACFGKRTKAVSDEANTARRRDACCSQNAWKTNLETQRRNGQNTQRGTTRDPWIKFGFSLLLLSLPPREWLPRPSLLLIQVFSQTKIPHVELRFEKVVAVFCEKEW